MAQQSKLRNEITSSQLVQELLDEVAAEFEKVLELRQRLTKEKDADKRGYLESQLYVAMVRSEVILNSAIQEWDRVVDEELE